MDKLVNISVPGPTVTPVSKPFWNGISEKKFRLQYCPSCSKWVFYPRSHCPYCWHNQLIWKEASGRGRLSTWSIVHKPGHPSWAEIVPYVVGLVTLAEGPTMLSQIIVNNPGQLEKDLLLKINYVKCGDHWLPFFKKEES